MSTRVICLLLRSHTTVGNRSELTRKIMRFTYLVPGKAHALYIDV